MAENFIEDIYTMSMIHYRLKLIANNARLFYDEDAVQELDETYQDLCDSVQKILDIDKQSGLAIWNYTKQLSSNGSDLIQIADCIEWKIIPEIEKFISKYYHIEENDDSGNKLVSSKSGFISLQHNDYWLHGYGNPMYEAKLMVDSLYNPKDDMIYVIGAGMGYHVYQLFLQLEKYGKITLLENDPLILQYASQFGVLGWIPEEYIEIHTDEDELEFAKRASENHASLYIHLPSVHAMQESVTKRLLIQKWMEINTRRMLKRHSDVNVSRNNVLSLPKAETLLQDKYCDEAIIIAAGPSLNDCLEWVRNEHNAQRPIIAVGTVFRKLLQEGIRPDYVVIIDPTSPIVNQVAGIEEENIPILLHENCYWEIARRYSGPRYILDKVITKTNGMKIPIYEGGTCAFTAIEVGLSLEVKEIYLVGFDFAYPGMMTHAKGATGYKEVDKNKLFAVPAIGGGIVNTDKHLDVYRQNVEGLIAQHKEIVFYNKSSKGAFIKGAIKK